MIGRVARAGSIAGVAAGIADAIVALSRGGATPAGAAVHAIVVAAGIWALAGAIAGLGAGLVLRGLSALEPLRAGATRVIGALRRPLAEDPVVAAAVPAAAITLGLLGVVDAEVFERFATGYRDAGLAAWAALVVLLGLDLVAIAVGAALYRALQAVGRRAPALRRPAATVWPTAGAVAVLGAGLALREGDRMALLPVAPAALGIGWCVATAVLARFVSRGRVVAPVAVAGLAVASALLHGRDAVATLALAERSALAGALLVRAAAATDVDGDGDGALFGGADCAPWDPEVSPGAIDRPGDGVDQNCSGRDARRTSPAAGPPGWIAVPETLSRANVLLLTVDALRRDRLAAYGRPGHAIAPALDRLARESLVFENAFAQSSRSLRSIPSMMTGRYASELGWGTEHLFQSLLGSNETIAERLSARGWETAAFVSTSYFAASAGFFQGFGAVHQDSQFKGSSARAAENAIAFVESVPAQGRFLAWVHLFDPHDPYGPGRRGTRAARYDGAVSRTDRQAGRILEALDRSAHRGRTVVIVASDHGESLGEHGQLTHGRNLYAEVLRVPLMVRAPGVRAGRSTALVGLLDLAETVKNLAEPPPGRTSSGRSLWPVLLGKRRSVRERLFAELLPDGEFPTNLESVTDGRFHLVRDLRTRVELLFDLARDPGELRDVSRERPAQRGRLARALDDFVDSAPVPQGRDEAIVARHLVARVPRRPWTRPAVRFGDCAVLEAVDLPGTRFRRGAALPLELYFRALGDCPPGARIGVGFTPDVRQRMPRLFGGWHTPVLGRYALGDWRRGEIVRDPVHLTVPRTLRPTRLTVRVSIGARGSPVETESGETEAKVGTIAVE